jgi:putative ABC transport system substrate-binding protein
MIRRKFITLLAGAAAWPLAARAQQVERSITRPRVAFLGAESRSTNEHFFDAFRQGMMEHGYVDGQNVILEQRWAEGRSERFPELVSELIGLKVDAIVAVSLPAAFAAKNETSTLPIVFIASDPLGSELVASLARPGGNLTGLSAFLGDEFSSKWLELLREAGPTASRVGVLWNPVNPASRHYVAVLRDAAQKLGVMLQLQAVSDPGQLDRAFAIARSNADCRCGGNRDHPLFDDPFGLKVSNRVGIVVRPQGATIGPVMFPAPITKPMA